jgi:hypothetical protein
MELLTQHLPSGFQGYGFPGIHINPMNFAQVLEYLDNTPKSEVEKFYFDYCVVRMDDEHVDNLLLPDLDYVIYLKKVITISRSCNFTSTFECPECHATLQKQIKIPEDIQFQRVDPKFISGIQIEIGGRIEEVKVPTMQEFMAVFNTYRRIKKVSDMRLIKMIALFRNAPYYPNYYEDLVTKATYEDITMLTMLSQMYYDIVKPITIYCPECNKGVEPENQRGITIEVESLIVDFFRDITLNNKIDESKILLK